MIEKVNLAAKFQLFDDHWSPKIIGEVANLYLKAVKLKGEFVWHRHETEDELFYVTKGRLVIKLRDGDVTLEAASRDVRKAGAPVVHVRHKGSPTGKAFNPTLSGYEIVKQLTPRDGEVIVDKGLPNAFAGTDLAKHLAAAGRKNLIVGGFMTHMCVSATVRSATDHGFMSTIAADTVATRDLPDATGGATVGADAINRITLAALSDRFAWIVPKAAAIA